MQKQWDRGHPSVFDDYAILVQRVYSLILKYIHNSSSSSVTPPRFHSTSMPHPKSGHERRREAPQAAMAGAASPSGSEAGRGGRDHGHAPYQGRDQGAFSGRDQDGQYPGSQGPPSRQAARDSKIYPARDVVAPYPAQDEHDARPQQQQQRDSGPRHSAPPPPPRDPGHYPGRSSSRMIVEVHAPHSSEPQQNRGDGLQHRRDGLQPHGDGSQHHSDQPHGRGEGPPPRPPGQGLLPPPKPARRSKSWSTADFREMGFSRESRSAGLTNGASARDLRQEERGQRDGRPSDQLHHRRQQHQQHPRQPVQRTTVSERHQLRANRHLAVPKETGVRDRPEPTLEKSHSTPADEGSAGASVTFAAKVGDASNSGQILAHPPKTTTTTSARKGGRRTVALLACGSFNPITNMHLRMFEIAKDALEKRGQFRVAGGIISPVSDSYGKLDLIPAKHRCRMVQLALRGNDWVKLDPWESEQRSWLETARVLQHHRDAVRELQQTLQARFQGRGGGGPGGVGGVFGVPSPKRKRKLDEGLESIVRRANAEPIELKLLCGADLLESFGTPGLWKSEDIEEIVGKFGLVCITRSGMEPNRFIYENDVLNRFRDNIFIVKEWIQSEISSTKIRRAIRRKESVRYLLQDSVIDYIKTNRLYSDPPPPSTRFSHLASPFPFAADPSTGDPRALVFPSYHPRSYPRRPPFQLHHHHHHSRAPSTRASLAPDADRAGARQRSASDLFTVPDLTSLTCRIKKWKVAVVNETRV